MKNIKTPTNNNQIPNLMCLVGRLMGCKGLCSLLEIEYILHQMDNPHPNYDLHGKKKEPEGILLDFLTKYIVYKDPMERSYKRNLTTNKPILRSKTIICIC